LTGRSDDRGQGPHALRSASALVFVAALDPGDDDLEIDPADAHHIVDVLRVGPRESIVAADGRGGWRPCVLRPRRAAHTLAVAGRRPPRRPRAADRRGDPAVLLEPTGPVVVEPAPEHPVTVGLALTKGTRTEWAVQKLTELGVDRIVPLVTERTVVQVMGRQDALARGERLRRIAREAAAQSRNPRLPVIADPAMLSAVLATVGEAGSRVAIAEPGGAPLEPGTATVLVGPEGGWTDAELASAPRMLGLGPTVLRAETAAVVAGALLTAVRAGTVHASS